MTSLLLNIDVDDLDRAVRFYTEAFGWRLGRKLGADFQELLGAPVPIYLLLNRSGSAPFEGARSCRDYARHWSPLHFDVVVEDIEAAVQRAVRLGATLEGTIRQEPYGRLATLSDPFGHGFCFLQFQGRGYDCLVQ